MKHVLILVALIFISGSSESEAPKKINPDHIKCSGNSECIIVLTECSCDCGIAINKTFEVRYRHELDEKCQDYQGKVCRMSCSGVPKCIDKKCVIVDPRMKAKSSFN